MSSSSLCDHFFSTLFQSIWFSDSQNNSKIPSSSFLTMISRCRAVKLDADDKLKTLDLFRLMATEGKIYNQQKFRNEHDQIYAFKPKPHRFMCFFFVGKRIIVTNGFIKKKDDLPPKEKKRALKFQKDYEERFKVGKYYET